VLWVAQTTCCLGAAGTRGLETGPQLRSLLDCFSLLLNTDNKWSVPPDQASCDYRSTPE
jgi:hypothetical protein